ncbi:MAG: hypothetical protein WAM82_15965 [Thermoanaerobaculia bacterium]
MLTTVEGVFRDGHVELREAPPVVEGARVIVTFLPDSSGAGADSSRSAFEANRHVLDLLHAWKAEPLTAEEERLLDDFESFQA